MNQLEDPLGASGVLELMLAQVAQRVPVHQLVCDPGGRGRRQQNLTPVSGGQNPLGPPESRPEVAPLAHHRLSHVQRHPHPERSNLTQRLIREPLLGLDTSAHAVHRRSEHGHHSTARRPHNLPIRGLYSVPKDHVMARESIVPNVPTLLPGPAAAFEVRQQEGESPPREARPRLKRRVPLQDRQLKGLQPGARLQSQLLTQQPAQFR